MTRLALAVAAVLSCNLALAAEPPAYVSASLGRAEQKLSLDGIDVSKTGTGGQIAGGYRFTPNAGIELGYTNFGRAEVSGQGATVSSRPQSIHLAVTGTWNATAAVAVTAKLGAARNHTSIEASHGGFAVSETETRTSPVYGIGASYKVDTDIAATLEYQNFGKTIKGDGADLKAHIVLVGIRYSY
jgi:OOP family OmpA-OmpF porin